MRALVRRLMQAEGFECVEAACGADALTLLAAHPCPLMLSDFHMPGMDGAELLKLVRQRWPQTAVVMITAVAPKSGSFNNNAAININNAIGFKKPLHCVLISS